MKKSPGFSGLRSESGAFHGTPRIKNWLPGPGPLLPGGIAIPEDGVPAADGAAVAAAGAAYDSEPSEPGCLP